MLKNKIVLVVLVTLTLSACGSMSKKEKPSPCGVETWATGFGIEGPCERRRF